MQEKSCSLERSLPDPVKQVELPTAFCIHHQEMLGKVYLVILEKVGDSKREGKGRKWMLWTGPDQK